MGTTTKAVVCVAAGVLLIGRAQAATPTPTQKCQEQKLKAFGKLQFCLKKANAKVIGGGSDGSAACKTKFAAALAKAGTTCRYLDNGDGTVSDLNTGLVWEKKDMSCPGPHCYTDEFILSTGAPWNLTGTAFTTFLYGLNGGTSPDGVAISGCFVGRCDWRLPTIEELAGILDTTQGNCGGGSGPCIDPVFGPTQPFPYWSATTDATFPHTGWRADFSDAYVAGEDKDDGFLCVRAVRGGL